MHAPSRQGRLAAACATALLALSPLYIIAPTTAAVLVTDDWTTLFYLEKPTGKFDEPALAGFEYLVSSRTGEFRANDQYLNTTEVSSAETSLVADLGAVGELSGTALEFSIRHSRRGGRKFIFTIDNPGTGIPSTLCWGFNCPAGSTAAKWVGGLAPTRDFNGIQLQLRAQEVPGSSASISGLSLSGVAISPTGTPLLEAVATPETASTVPFDPPGRLIQWILGDKLELSHCEWVLSGTITLVRDSALEDLTKVRLAVDLVNDLRLPAIGSPLPTGTAPPLRNPRCHRAGRET